jgi:mannose-1-phosphate guanylyltransferase
MLYAVIMAGGIGSRFWPQSRQARPKQFLNVLGDATLIQNTLGRMQGLVPPERCYVVTHERYVTQTQEQLPALPPENVLAEPISRNTAPCIAFAAMKLLAEDPDATMMVLPADHLISNVRQFHDVLRVAEKKAQEPGALVTIGITPTHPETGYGYIQYDPSTVQDPDVLQTYPVRTFAEKPDVATAERFLDSGNAYALGCPAESWPHACPPTNRRSWIDTRELFGAHHALRAILNPRIQYRQLAIAHL